MEIQLVEDVAKMRVLRLAGHGLISGGGATDAQQFALGSYNLAWVLRSEEFGSPLHNPSCLDFLPRSPLDGELTDPRPHPITLFVEVVTLAAFAAVIDAASLLAQLPLPVRHLSGINTNFLAIYYSFSVL